MPTNLVVRKSISTDIREKWGWFLFLGIVFVLAGVLAISLPLMSSLAVGALLAIVMVIAGAVQIWQSFRLTNWGGFLWHLIVGIVVLVGGLSIYMFPIFGSFALTLVVASVFIAKGVFQIALSLRLRPHDGWGWILTAGIVALLAGIFILAQYPFSGLWVPGTLAGVSLLFTGWSYVAVSLAAKRLGSL